MTVKELIEKLQAYPSDMLVACWYELEWDKDDIRVIDDFPAGDINDPTCERIDHVLNIGW